MGGAGPIILMLVLTPELANALSSRRERTTSSTC